MLSVALLLVLSQIAGVGRTLPWSLFPFQTGRILWLVLTALFLGVLFSARWRSVVLARSTPILARRSALALLVLANAAFALLNWQHYERFGYIFPVTQFFLIGICAFTVRLGRPWISCVLSIGLLASSMFYFPLAPQRSDMLPVISMSLDQWVRGISPYQWSVFADGAPARMIYLPGTLFSHLPAWLLGMDLRWNTVLYRLCWMVLLFRGLRRSSASPLTWGVFHLFVLNPYLNYRHELYLEFFLLLVVAYWTAPRSRWLLIPLMIVTRQWAWVIAPFLILVELQDRRRLPLLAAGFLAVLGGSVLLLARSTSWELFRQSLLVFDNNFGHSGFYGDYGFSLAPLFFHLGLSKLFQPAQAFVCFTIFSATYWFWRTQRERVYRSAAICWCLFLMLNSHYWLYFWLSPALWILASEARAENPRLP